MSSTMTQIRRSKPESPFTACLMGAASDDSGMQATRNRRRKRTRPTKSSLFQIASCCCVGSFLLAIGSLVVDVPTRIHYILSSELWRVSHHSNPDIERLQLTFPVHVNGDMERIGHPGFELADPKRLAAVLDGIPIAKDIEVPRFWDPPAYKGVREFLGDSGKYLISSSEAQAIGSKFQEKETIFVSVASYRDPECLLTVEDIFQRAKHPERVRVAIVDQRTPGDDSDPSCAPPSPESCEVTPTHVLCKYGHLIDRIEYEAQLMVGPVFARHLGQRMYRGEYFAMQVDSHVRFVQNWDEDIIDQWKATGNEMAVLSTYLMDIVNSIDPESHQSLRESRPIMCNAEFEWKGDSKAHVRYSVQPTNKPKLQSTPMLQPFWAAGFSFSRGHFLVQVPYDRYLPLVFQGEEISMTVRGFTYGYDFYAPVRNVAFHIYGTRDNQEKRSHVKSFTENAALFPGAKEEAYYRLNGIIGSGKPVTKFNQTEMMRYGVGGARKAETFYRVFGIHTERGEMEKGLCDFVQGIGLKISMHQTFSPFLRYNGMGIDYGRIDFKYIETAVVDSLVDPVELAALRQRLRPQSTSQL